MVSDLRVWAVAASSQLPRPHAHTPARPAGTRSTSGDTFFDFVRWRRVGQGDKEEAAAGGAGPPDL